MTLYLILYLATLVLHVGLVSYVLVGAGWLTFAKQDDPIALVFRDWLPFSIGAAITAGVAPLLFVQLLYQERFYTANLLLSHRWMAVIPALIAGFYASYLAKARKTRVWALVALVCFLFVAWSWTENHLLSLHPEVWRSMYGAGKMTYFEPSLPPRLLLWLGLAGPAAATIASWQAPAQLPRLRILAFGGLAVAVAAAAWLHATLDAPARDALLGGPGTALAIALAACEALLVIAWLRGWRAVASVALVAALAVGAVLRERLRLPVLETVRPRVADAGGFYAFVFFFVVNTALVVWCVRSARRHAQGLAQP